MQKQVDTGVGNVTLQSGGGHVDHNETTTTQSVFTGNIGVDAGSSTGSYSTDLTAANGHLDIWRGLSRLTDIAIGAKIGMRFMGN
ncbi:hypothetical protein [Acetobacter senegalensis]